MSIVILGGHHRMEKDYKALAKKEGISLKVYNTMPGSFRKSLGYPDHIVAFTDTISHKFMNSALKESNRKNINLIRSHSSSKNALESIIKNIKARA